MGKIVNITEAAKYLNVAVDTLRMWDKNGKLKAMKTPGGHRRYDIETLDSFIGKNSQYTYGNLYEFLCSAQDVAYALNDENAPQIEEVRVKIGEKLLQRYNHLK